MDRHQDAARISVPPVGFKARTQADGLRRMGVETSDSAMPGNAAYKLRENKGDTWVEVVFLTENSKNLDLVSVAPNGRSFILEHWDGGRDASSIGNRRHTFVRPEVGAPYEYVGDFAIEALFHHEVQNDEEDTTETIALWERKN
ncbi:MAG: hypothetical protein ABF966_09625 [Bifidobacterium psychraerophilum]|uniref:hypothetical protein n=1 Tax=Bifidobacterium psychraerophilum TaxID=218140 RepID=UPI0039EC3144